MISETQIDSLQVQPEVEQQVVERNNLEKTSKINTLVKEVIDRGRRLLQIGKPREVLTDVAASEDSHIFSEVKEKEPINVENVFVLVHPLGSGIMNNSISEMQQNIQTRFVPGKSDLIWMVPFVGTESIGEAKIQLRKFNQYKKYDQKTPNWSDLYKDLRATHGRDKVRLMPEFVFSSHDDRGRPRMDDMIERSKAQGKVIGPDTNIVLGGQQLDLCVKNGAINLLRSKVVTKVVVDTRAGTFSSGDRQGGIQRIISDVNSTKVIDLEALYDEISERIIITKQAE